MANPIKIAKGIESLLKQQKKAKTQAEKLKAFEERKAIANKIREKNYPYKYDPETYTVNPEPYIPLGWMEHITPARFKIADVAIRALEKLEHLPRGHPKRMKVLNDTIAKLEELKKLPGENFSVLAAPALEEALAKMAETTMMPEESFGTKAGNLLIDVLSPVPRYK